jgi:hypothetical protein
VASCGGDGEDGAADGTSRLEAEAFDNTTILDADELAAILRVEADGTIVFESLPPSLAGLERLNVLVAGMSEATPQGLLRLVTAVETGADVTRVRTVPAPIQVAFRRLDAELTRTVDHDQLTAALKAMDPGAEKRNGFLRLRLDEPLFDADRDPSTPDDQVVVDALLEGGFDYTFGIQFDWGAVARIPLEVLECTINVFKGDGCSVRDLLPEARMGYYIESGLLIDLEMRGVAYRSFERSWVVPGITLEPIPIGFLVFIPQVDLDVSMSGSASSRFSLSASVDTGVEAGVRISSHDGIEITPPDAWFEYEAPQIDPTLSAQASAHVGPRIALKLYGIMGPFAAVRGYADLSADFDRDPCFQAYAGLDGAFGLEVAIDVPLFGRVNIASWDTDFEFLRREIGSGVCPGSAGPGTGPGTLEGDFQAPSFDPWAATYGSVLHLYPFEGPGAQAEWSQLLQDIDGRWVFGGSTSRAVVKFGEWGEHLWSRRYLSPDVAEDLETRELMMGAFAPTRDAGLLAVAHPYALLELSPSGDVRWARRFDARYRQSWSRFTDVAALPDGGFVVVGMHGTEEYAAREVDTWVLTLDREGEVATSRLYGEPGAGEMALDVLPLDDGVLVVGSTWFENPVEWRGSAMRLDAAGDVTWAKRFPLTDCYGHGDDMHVQRAILTEEGDFVLGGTVDSGPIGAAIIKLKPDGALAWSEFNTGAGTAIGTTFTDIVALPTSGYLIAGTYIAGDGDDDVWLGSTTSAGQLQWLMRYGRRQDPGGARTAESYPSLALTEDGGVMLATPLLRSVGDGTDTDGGLWAMKLPARSGEIELSPESGFEARSGGMSSKEVCMGVEDWTVSARSLEVTPETFDVRVEDVTSAVERQAN